jgi:hypothetical protein
MRLNTEDRELFSRGNAMMNEVSVALKRNHIYFSKGSTVYLCGKALTRWFEIQGVTKIIAVASKKKKNKNSVRFKVRKIAIPFTDRYTAWRYSKDAKQPRSLMFAETYRILDKLFPEAKIGDIKTVWLTIYEVM